MSDTLHFPFIQMDQQVGDASALPMLPFRLAYHQNTIQAMGLLDTGATVNVLPYGIGIALGAIWEEEAVNLQLTGNLARYPAQPLFLDVLIGSFRPIELVFAWTRAETAPLLLGHINFFAKFDVCIFRSQGFFELTPIFHTTKTG